MICELGLLGKGCCGGYVLLAPVQIRGARFFSDPSLEAMP
jgi:hypothetical protein